MQAYTELLPPTAVTHALSLSFTSKKAQNLIVIKISLLQIFRVKRLQDATSSGSNSVDAPSSPTLTRNATNDVPAKRARSKLVLVGEYALSGTVTSIAAIKAMETRSGGHALLVSFMDAKISLVQWDPEIYSISTISIHYYENEALQGAPWAPELGQCDSYLTVDPSNRCAAFKFGQRHLAILPFRQPGDDLAMGEYDPDADESHTSGPVKANGEPKQPDTPYASSFVLPLTALDSNLIHPVDLAFLQGYREPTLGVLASAKAPAMSLIQERKDPLTYTVFTLDLEQRARTPLLSVSGLPADLFKLVPLPGPVGGTLLVGGNELIHVDQSGKTTAIAVNDFARECSSFSMTDQADLKMRLEHCVLAQIDKSKGAMLLILDSGEFAILSFGLDGRSVNSLSVQRISPEQGGDLSRNGATCTAALDEGLLFVGGQDCDALLLSYDRSDGLELTRKRSHAEMLGLDDADEDEEEDLEDDDDLYGNDTVPTKAVTSSGHANGAFSGQNIKVHVEDRLLNLSATGPPTFSPSSIRQSVSEHMAPGLDLAIPTGSGSAGSIAFATRSMKLNVASTLDIASVRDAWSLSMSSEEHPAGFDNVLLVSHVTEDGIEKSSVHKIGQDEQIKEQTGTDFEGSIATLNAGVLHKATRLVQVSHSEIRCYDSNFGLSQIYPMIDEETDIELKIKSSSFCDPYLLVIREDFSAVVLQVDANGELDEVEQGEAMSKTQWISGCVYKAASEPKAAVYLLDSKGTLNVFQLPNLAEPSYITDLRNLPTTLTASGQAKRLGAELAAPVEVLVCDLGDEVEMSMQMIVRTDDDELTLYEPYYYPATTPLASSSLSNLRWRKSTAFQPTSRLPNGLEETPRPLRRLEYGGRAAVVMHRACATMIVKDAGSSPRSYRIDDAGICAVNSIHTETHLNALLLVDTKGNITVARVPTDTNYGTTGWAVKRLDIDEGIDGVVFHPATSSYVVTTSKEAEFTLPEDDWHPEWTEEKINFKPQMSQGAIKLIDATSQKIIHEMIFDPEETVLCMKIINLEISEHTHERKPMIVVGTAKVQGEDHGCGGSIYVFDVIHVVPDPERPEGNKALKMVAREELKGPVTALCEVGNEGFLFHAQGQKCMVRGLKEDSTLLPVAFLDVQCLVTSVKNVKGTGLVLIADAMKGVWLAGYSPEPYLLRVFGKSRSRMEVLAAEFLPQDKQLFLLLADGDCNIHVLEFNPEDPKSLSGQRLLHRSTFHTGHFPISMTLLPTSTPPPTTSSTTSTPDPTSTPTGAQSPILLTSQSGSLSLLTPLSESTYRRLSALQTHLIGILDHPCGLNPRAYRAVESEGPGTGGGGAGGARGVLDGAMLKRWGELSSQKKREACKRVGEEVGTVRGWLEGLGGGEGGLVYL